MPRDPVNQFDADAAGRRPLGEVAGKVAGDFQDIFRAEVRLAAGEIKDNLRKSAKAVRPLAGAGLLGFFAAASFVTFCIVALTIVLPLWLAALLMTVALGGAAGGAFLLGRMALDEVDPVPQQTLETLKDNIDWARNRAS